MAAISISLQSTIYLILSLVTLIGLRRRYFSPISDIPGPFFASFSSAWLLYHALKGHTEAAVLAEHKKHGTFVRISQKEVSVCHPDAVRLVLKSKMNKGDFYRIFAIPDLTSSSNLLDSQMSCVDSREHMRITKNLSAGYSLPNILRCESAIDSLITRFHSRLEQLSSSKSPVHFSAWFNYLAFDIMGVATFSRTFGFLDAGQDIGGAIAANSVMALYVSIMSHFWRLHGFLMGNSIVKYAKLVPTLHTLDTCTAAMAARESMMSRGCDMMQLWKERRATHSDMGAKEAFAAAMCNTGAGAETVSAAMQAVVYLLLRNEQALEELRFEIDRARLHGVPSYSDIVRLPFLYACVKEALRVHSPVGFGLPRVVGAEGVRIDGRHFGEGTVLSVNPWIMHRQTDVFGDDAEEFSPWRWLDEKREKEMDKCFIPFGAGYNQCPGKHLAWVEILKTIALLIRDFDIRQVDVGKEWSFRVDFVAVPWGWPCWVSKRNQDEG